MNAGKFTNTLQDESPSIELTGITKTFPGGRALYATLPAKDFGLGNRCSLASSNSQYSIPKASCSGKPI